VSGGGTRVLAALAERGGGDAVRVTARSVRRSLDTVVDVGAHGTWTQTPMKDETR
jgi:hypothetical protein